MEGAGGPPGAAAPTEEVERPEDSIPDLPENAAAREFLKNAPEQLDGATANGRLAAADDPLSVAQDSSWKDHFDHHETKEQIHKDVRASRAGRGVLRWWMAEPAHGGAFRGSCQGRR